MKISAVDKLLELYLLIGLVYILVIRSIITFFLNKYLQQLIDH